MAVWLLKRKACDRRAWWLAAMLATAGTMLGTPARADTAAGLADFRAGQFSEAVAAWRDAAATGDPAAALYLGVLYDTGFGVPQSPVQALSWYKRGGDGGNPTALLNAAIMMDAGRGTPANPAEAAPWYERAAQAGSGRAAYNLGLLYEHGIGVPKDRAKATDFFRQAVADGVAEGRAHLSRMGQRHAGKLGTPRVDVAMVSFKRAQDALLARGPDGDMQAAALFRKSAEAGNALAAYNLGYCYEHGIGVSANVDQAMAWYRRSASAATDPALRDIAQAGERSLAAGVDHVQR